VSGRDDNDELTLATKNEKAALLLSPLSVIPSLSRDRRNRAARCFPLCHPERSRGIATIALLTP
jgi:hypothetical protein